MTSRSWHFLFHARMLSPKGLLLRAFWLAVLFLIVHGLGWRDYTSIFSGTSPHFDEPSVANARALLDDRWDTA